MLEGSLATTFPPPSILPWEICVKVVHKESLSCAESGIVFVSVTPLNSVQRPVQKSKFELFRKRGVVCAWRGVKARTR